MKIVCLVKQVPRADSIEFDPETYTPLPAYRPAATRPQIEKAISSYRAYLEQNTDELVANVEVSTGTLGCTYGRGPDGVGLATKIKPTMFEMGGPF